MTPPEAKALDIQRLMASAEELAFPRYPGTEGDSRAIRLVAERLRETGLAVQEEWFSYDLKPAFRALRAMMLVTAALVAAAGMLLDSSPLLSGLLLTVALGGSGVFLLWAPWLERLYSLPGPTRTANLWARSGEGTPRLTLILLAHHDSKSQNLSLPFRGALTLVAIGGALGLVALLVARALVTAPAGPWWPAVGLGAVTAGSLLVLSTLTNGNASPGGVDNAGSVGVLLELARLLPSRLPPGIELIFLSPGAEEDHMIGAMRWLDSHRDSLTGRPVLAINLDGAGIPGRIVLLERYGLGRMFAPELSTLARKAAAKLDLQLRGVLLPPAMGVDAIPFVHRGIPCLTLASGSLGRASLSVHSKNDRFEHLDASALQAITRLVVEMAELLVAEWKNESRGPGAPADASRMDDS